MNLFDKMSSANGSGSQNGIPNSQNGQNPNEDPLSQQAQMYGNQENQAGYFGSGLQSDENMRMYTTLL